MKKSIYNILLAFIVAAGTSCIASAQAAKKSAADSGKIVLSAYVPQQAESIPAGADAMLTNKLNQVISQNGMASDSNSKFIITPNIVVLTKDLLATAPPMTALTLQVMLCIGNGVEGRKFVSTVLTVKGVGTNENKAYMEAIKQINPGNPAIQSFVADGKAKILEYYNTKCPTVLTEAKALEQQNKLDEAIYMLTSVPDAAADCYKKSMAAAEPLYKRKIDTECRQRLQEATSIWNANQTVAGANQAGELLVAIDPHSACYADVKSLSDRIGKRVQEIDNREWQFKVDKEIGLERDRIQAIRDIGVAYASRPRIIVYNVRGWW
jgi:hypothetical protein